MIFQYGQYRLPESLAVAAAAINFYQQDGQWGKNQAGNNGANDSGYPRLIAKYGQNQWQADIGCAGIHRSQAMQGHGGQPAGKGNAGNYHANAEHAQHATAKRADVLPVKEFSHADTGQ